MNILGFIELWKILVLAILLLLLITPILALIDILRNEFTGNNKLIWTLVVLFGSFLGAGLYFLFGRKQKIGNGKNTIDPPKQ